MGVQQPLIRLIDSRLDRGYTEIIGTATSVVYKWFDKELHEYMWVMDVDIAKEGTRPDATSLLRSVPVADASHGVHKAGPGAKVRLRRMSLKRSYEIVGLAAITNGQVHVIEVAYSETGYTQGATTTFGSTYSALNYTDLGDSASNGGYTYGKLPYGTLGKYNAQGTLQYIFTTP